MDELQRLQGLKDELLIGLDRVLSSGEILSDEYQGLIAGQLEWLQDRIEELSGSVDGLAPSPPEKIKLSRPMPSSNVHSFGYDDKTGNLLVKFQGDYPDQNGPVYGYSGVPKQIFEQFRQGAIPAKTTGKNEWGEWWRGKQPSLGASFYELIRNGGYQHQRLA